MWFLVDLAYELAAKLSEWVDKTFGASPDSSARGAIDYAMAIGSLLLVVSQPQSSGQFFLFPFDVVFREAWQVLIAYVIGGAILFWHIRDRSSRKKTFIRFLRPIWSTVLLAVVLPVGLLGTMLAGINLAAGRSQSIPLDYIFTESGPLPGRILAQLIFWFAWLIQAIVVTVSSFLGLGGQVFTVLFSFVTVFFTLIGLLFAMVLFLKASFLAAKNLFNAREIHPFMPAIVSVFICFNSVYKLTSEAIGAGISWQEAVASLTLVAFTAILTGLDVRRLRQKNPPITFANPGRGFN